METVPIAMGGTQVVPGSWPSRSEISPGYGAPRLRFPGAQFNASGLHQVQASSRPAETSLLVYQDDQPDPSAEVAEPNYSPSSWHTSLHMAGAYLHARSFLPRDAQRLWQGWRSKCAAKACTRCTSEGAALAMTFSPHIRAQHEQYVAYV